MVTTVVLRRVVVGVLFRLVVVVSIMLRVDVMVVPVVTHGSGQVRFVHLHLLGSRIHRNCAAADQCVTRVVSCNTINSDSVEGDGLAHDIVVTSQVLQQVVLCKALRIPDYICRANKVELAS
jgi:hypothetical protein